MVDSFRASPNGYAGTLCSPAVNFVYRIMGEVGISDVPLP